MVGRRISQVVVLLQQRGLTRSRSNAGMPPLSSAATHDFACVFTHGITHKIRMVSPMRAKREQKGGQQGAAQQCWEAEGAATTQRLGNED